MNQTEIKELWFKKDPKYEKLTDHFFKTAPESFTQDVYELSRVTGIPVPLWKEFIHDTEIQIFIRNEIDDITSSNARGAVVALKESQSSVEVAKNKHLIALANKKNSQDFKPFNVYFLPKTVKLYKQALVDLFHLAKAGTLSPEDAINKITSVLPELNAKKA